MLKWVLVALTDEIVYDSLLGIYNSYEEALFAYKLCVDEDIKLEKVYCYKIEGVELR